VPEWVGCMHVWQGHREVNRQGAYMLSELAAPARQLNQQ
jgi:hypothetical protein